VLNQLSLTHIKPKLDENGVDMPMLVNKVQIVTSSNGGEEHFSLRMHGSMQTILLKKCGLSQKELVQII
jgi:hypothetical protein